MTTPTSIALWSLTAASRLGSAWTRTTCRGCARAAALARRHHAQLVLVSAALLKSEDELDRQRREIGHLEARVAELLKESRERAQALRVSDLCDDDRHTACGGCPACACHTVGLGTAGASA